MVDQTVSTLNLSIKFSLTYCESVSSSLDKSTRFDSLSQSRRDPRLPCIFVQSFLGELGPIYRRTLNFLRTQYDWACVMIRLFSIYNTLFELREKRSSLPPLLPVDGLLFSGAT